VEFHTPHFREVSNVRPEESGRILRFALTLTLIPARFPSRSGGNLKEGGEIQQEPVARKRIKTAWRTATGNPTVSHALVRCAVRWARRKNASGRACAATKSAFTSGAKRPSDPTFSTSIAPRRACASKSTATYAQRSAEDRQRDLYLQQLGILTLRVPSGELYAHLNAVVEYIAHLWRERTNLQEQG
jgi:hypothetical protein